MSLLEYLLSKAWLRACYLVCTVLPVRQNRVVFASARAEKLVGNLRFIHEELARQHPDLECVFLLDRYSYSLLGKIGYLLTLSRACYHLATAHYVVVDNAYLPIHVGPHRRQTKVIQVWHAGGALKKFGVDVDSPHREVENRFLHKYYDYVIAPSQRSVAPYASALRTDPARVLPLGLARADFFFDEDAKASARERIHAAYPALAGKRVVLYAPTFRGQGVAKHVARDLDAPALRASLPDDTVLVYKPHPVLEITDEERAGFDEVIRTGFDVNELFAIADVLITDYSSSIFEYVLLNKPLVVLASDLAEYERDPGFYLDFRREMVGSCASDTRDVIRIIAEDDFDLAAYAEFQKQFCEHSDGHATERIVEFIVGL